jgi:hypothetical protein
MNAPKTALQTTSPPPSRTSRLPPDEVWTAQARTSVDADEWHVVRKGLGLMTGCLTVFLICTVGTLLTDIRRPDRPPVVLLNFFFFAGLPLSGAGFLAGVVLTLIAPQRAQGKHWVRVYLGGLIAAVGLLLAQRTWQRGGGWQVASWSETGRALIAASAAALLLAFLGYCFYLAALARGFGARRLAGCFKAFFAALAVVFGVVALAQATGEFWQHRWAPHLVTIRSVGLIDLFEKPWKGDLFVFAGGMFLVLGVVWTVLLWRLKQCLPPDTGR